MSLWNAINVIIFFNTNIINSYFQCQQVFEMKTNVNADLYYLLLFQLSYTYRLHKNKSASDPNQKSHSTPARISFNRNLRVCRMWSCNSTIFHLTYGWPLNLLRLNVWESAFGRPVLLTTGPYRLFSIEFRFYLWVELIKI